MVEQGISRSREQAKRSVMAGLVMVNGHKAAKPGQEIKPGDSVTLLEQEPYVSRGGRKLEHALTTFGLNLEGVRAIDLGASTGGFTDCLLQAGARQVYAIDVGQGLLAWKLRVDPRVVVMEKTNARHLRPDSFPQGFEPVDLVVADCSFISLKLVLPPALPLLKTGGFMIALIKPQFEAGKADVDKGRGVIVDPEIHRRITTDLCDFVTDTLNLQWHKVIPSPILGPAGNKEFLILIEKI